MNKVFAGLGFILIVAGLLVSAVGSTKFEKWAVQVVQTAYNSWSVGGANLSSGETFRVNIVRNTKWDTGVLEAPTDDYPYGYMDIWLDVTDPYGNKTTFVYTWARQANPSDSSSMIVMAANVTVEENGSLIDPGIQIVGAAGPGGIARYSGSYSAKITSIMAGGYPYYPSYPPGVIQFVKAIQVGSQPYSSALPFGVASFIGGVAASIYGMKSDEKKFKRKRARALKEKSKVLS